MHRRSWARAFRIDPNSNEYLVAKIGFDTAENEPCTVYAFSVYRFPQVFGSYNNWDDYFTEWPRTRQPTKCVGDYNYANATLAQKGKLLKSGTPYIFRIGARNPEYTPKGNTFTRAILHDRGAGRIWYGTFFSARFLQENSGVICKFL